MKKSKEQSKIKLLVCDEKNPSIKIKPGMNIHVEELSLVDTDLEEIKKMGARLCGGSGTCLALVDLLGPLVNPVP